MIKIHRENEKLRDVNDNYKTTVEQQKIQLNELQAKLKVYVSDYERFFQENKRLKEQLIVIRDEKETALIENQRIKMLHHN